MFLLRMDLGWRLVSIFAEVLLVWSWTKWWLRKNSLVYILYSRLKPFLRVTDSPLKIFFFDKFTSMFYGPVPPLCPLQYVYDGNLLSLRIIRLLGR